MVKPGASIWRQVITVHPDGSISGLQRKSGEGVDLRQFGKADIQRASDIQWDVEAQSWTVCVLEEDTRYSLTASRLYAVSGFRELPSCVVSENDVLLFKEYASAVDAEIFYLDNKRLNGRKPN